LFGHSYHTGLFWRHVVRIRGGRILWRITAADAYVNQLKRK